MHLSIYRDGMRFKVSLEGSPDRWISQENISAILLWLERWHVREIQKLEERLTEIEFFDDHDFHRVDLPLNTDDWHEFSTLIEEQSEQNINTASKQY